MELDKEAISEFLLFGYPLNDKSFRKAKKTKIKIDVPKLEKNKNTTINDVENALKNSIKKLTKNKKKIGVLLSGGKDSRLLLALSHSLELDVTAITVGDVDNRAEEKAASKIAKTLKIPHKIIRIPKNISSDVVSEINEVTDGIIPFSGVTPIYLIRDKLSKHFDVALNGNLMTEIMDTCEYRWYDSDNPIEVMQRKRFQGGILLQNEYLEIAKNNFLSTYDKKTLEEIILGTEFKPRMTGIKALEKLVETPIAIPASDSKVISSTFSLPLEKRINGRLVISILKKSYPEIARVKSPKTIFPLYYPWWIHYGWQRIKEKYYYYINGGKIWGGYPRRHKMGMWDQGYFFKYRIGSYVKKSLEQFDFEIIKKDVVKKIIYNHFSEKKDETAFISKLLTLKNWLDINNN